MKSYLLAYAACAALAVGTFPGVAIAQQDDIAKRQQAMEDCNVEGYRGYGTYEACVEQRYQDLLNEPPAEDDPEYWGGRYGCSAATRIPC